MKRKKSAEEISPEKKLVQDAIKEVLEDGDRARAICTDPQEDGSFAPIITIDGHAFKTVISYDNESIAMEMYERVILDKQEIESFLKKVERANNSEVTSDGGKKWMRLSVTKDPKHFAVLFMVYLDKENGKDREKIAEALRTKFSSAITMITMLYFGMFDEPEKDVAAQATPSSAA